MSTIKRSHRAFGRTAWHGLGAYGTLRYVQGRLSGRRAARSRARLFGAAGAGLAVGLLAGFAIRSTLGGGCDHEHADVPVASAGEPTANVGNGVLSA